MATALESRVEDQHYSESGLRFQRMYTREGVNPLDEVEYDVRESTIIDRNTKGVLFHLDQVEAPKSWSQLAVDIAAEKYFRDPENGVETSVRSMVERVAYAIADHGIKHGYFASREDGENFRSELAHLLIHQKAAFNSPVWFNVGLFEKYGVRGESVGNWAYDHERGEVVLTQDTYSRPQAPACFIQSVDDDLMDMLDLQKSEVRLFKQGSGTGTNFSNVRGKKERISGGGYSSGVISFLNAINGWAGSIKSGGTTRRAAKMVILDQDHPEIFDFVDWKLNGELMARDLIAAGWPSDYEEIVYSTVPGQNSNNSVRLDDEFMGGVGNPEAKFVIRNRKDGSIRETRLVNELWAKINHAAYECADPGVQFHTTINDWHTCSNSGPIRGSNPCSEYMFLDNSACNLASINVMKFLNQDGTFDVEGYKHAIRVIFTGQEILVGKASYPTKEIARNSEDFRPLGLGYANLGAVLMNLGIPYDSEAAESMTGSLTAIMTGEAYAQSARIAGTRIGPFNRFNENREPFLRVMNKHRGKVEEIRTSKGLEYLIDSAREVWNRAIELGEQNGYRNAQATVLAPTGTIGLLMDCDTTGIEPDFSLVKYKKLAGGGSVKIVNQGIPNALRRLGYSEDQIADVNIYVVGHNSAKGSPHLKQEHYAEAMSVEEFDRPRKLKELGYKPRQVRDIINFIDGFQVVEGAPHVSEEHYPIFDTANPGRGGTRFIAPMGHVNIMAAAQPFISGAISKTVNLPNDATEEDISDVYLTSWKKGIKAIAIYREGCKSSQPLNTGRHEEGNLEKEALMWGQKKRLPPKREGITIPLEMANHVIYLRTGEYDEGELGEIFIDASKEGSALRSSLNSFAVSVSKGLQHGVPLENLVATFVETQSEPRGPVKGYEPVKMAMGIHDLIFRVLGIEYLGASELATEPSSLDLTKTRLFQNKQREAMKRIIDQGIEIGSQNPEEIMKSMKNGNGKLKKSSASGPPCPRCGGFTSRSGSCYKCHNCTYAGGCG